ncbi:MAG: formylglycine-generating enzyme family protein, partial [Methanomethylovorans sp.]|nr:formylglycine-generating enzyme family protein [Methanomethylovorans sp.]
FIPAGEFKMDSNNYSYKNDNIVTIQKPFYLGRYPVTQKEWKSVMGYNPSCFEGDDRPIECVSWYDVQDFITKLNVKENTNKYRLPTETEWEFACRAGTTTKYSFGDTDSKLGEYAWYYGNSEHQTHPVGMKKPNPWGLYDMHGNVWEWCQNTYYENYADDLDYADNWEDITAFSPALRGGSWVNYPRKCRSAYRLTFHPNYGHYSLGFRLLRSL